MRVVAALGPYAIGRAEAGEDRVGEELVADARAVEQKDAFRVKRSIKLAEIEVLAFVEKHHGTCRPRLASDMDDGDPRQHKAGHSSVFQGVRERGVLVKKEKVFVKEHRGGNHGAPQEEER